MKQRKITIEKYCSEIDWDNELAHDCINLVIANTGSGKSTSIINDFPRDRRIAILAPFTALTSQLYAANPDFRLETGTSAREQLNFANGTITSFHSAPRLLEMEKIDLLVIDELHYLVNYAGFTYGMINTMWGVVDKLRIKFPDMKIVALTATPQFVRLATFLNLNIIEVEQRVPTSKPSSLHISKSWTADYAKDHTFIALYPSRKLGLGWAKKYRAAYVDSSVKELSSDYLKIIEGKMPNKKLFTSTLLSTGISILDPVDTVYTNWLDLVDIVQTSARPRRGDHQLKVTRTPKPFYMDVDMPEPQLVFGKDIEENFRKLNEYARWYSLQAHQDEKDLYSIVYQMLWAPGQPLPYLGTL